MHQRSTLASSARNELFNPGVHVSPSVPVALVRACQRAPFSSQHVPYPRHVPSLAVFLTLLAPNPTPLDSALAASLQSSLLIGKRGGKAKSVEYNKGTKCEQVEKGRIWRCVRIVPMQWICSTECVVMVLGEFGIIAGILTIQTPRSKWNPTC